VNTTIAGSQHTPAVIMDSNSNFIITWIDQNDLDGNGEGIFMQRYNSSGVPIDGEVQVNQTYTLGDQRFPRIAVDLNDNFIITWVDYNGADGSQSGIFSKKYNSNGVEQGGVFQVNTYYAGDQYGSEISMNLDGDFVISWTDNNSHDGDGEGVFAQMYSAVSCPDTGQQDVRVIHGGGGSSAPPAPKAAPPAPIDIPIVKTAVCGNAILESGEECDDGNVLNGDGCNSDCSLGEILPAPEIVIIDIKQPTRKNNLIITLKVIGLGSGVLTAHGEESEAELVSDDYLPNIPLTIEIPVSSLRTLQSFDFSRAFFDFSSARGENVNYYELFSKAMEEVIIPIRLQANSADGSAEIDVEAEMDNFPPSTSVDTEPGRYMEPINVRIYAE